jgi:hypothetical protein
MASIAQALPWDAARLDLAPNFAPSQYHDQARAEDIASRQFSRLRPARHFFLLSCAQFGHSMIALRITPAGPSTGLGYPGVNHFSWMMVAYDLVSFICTTRL